MKWTTHFEMVPIPVPPEARFRLLDAQRMLAEMMRVEAIRLGWLPPDPVPAAPVTAVIVEPEETEAELLAMATMATIEV
jgi:hypothetical protein